MFEIFTLIKADSQQYVRKFIFARRFYMRPLFEKCSLETGTMATYTINDVINEPIFLSCVYCNIM